MMRKEKKELDKIAKRFRVITPAEFEKNLQMVKEITGGDEARNNCNSGNMSDFAEDKPNSRGGDQVTNSNNDNNGQANNGP